MFRRWLLRKLGGVDRKEFIKLYQEHGLLVQEYANTVDAISLMVGQAEWKEQKQRYAQLRQQRMH